MTCASKMPNTESVRCTLLEGHEGWCSCNKSGLNYMWDKDFVAGANMVSPGDDDKKCTCPMRFLLMHGCKCGGK